MDDPLEKIRQLEQALFEQMLNANSLKYSLQAIKVYLLANSPEPEEVAKFLDDAQVAASKFDPQKEFWDQVGAYIEFLKSGKKSGEHDA
ncbi:MAG TPA: hypothetical protein VIX37_15575 [Candidatus Sulfotelmatobacter sp.]